MLNILLVFLYIRAAWKKGPDFVGLGLGESLFLKKSAKHALHGRPTFRSEMFIRTLFKDSVDFNLESINSSECVDILNQSNYLIDKSSIF